ncbi:MAG TPA: hypothetical protein VH701_20125 [Vicinamibacterales bacterium]|jgi:hypothetical protein
MLLGHKSVQRESDKGMGVLEMFSAVFVIMVWLVLVCARPAYAYLDPGSGGMMVQLLLGGFAGAAVLVRLYWRQLLIRVGLRKPDVSNETNS